MIALLTPVKVGIPQGNVIEWKPAVLIGRTREETPVYDVRLDSGEFLSRIPSTLIQEAA